MSLCLEGLRFLTSYLHVEKMNLQWEAPRIHCTDEETRSWRGQVIFPGSYRQAVSEVGFKRSSW